MPLTGAIAEIVFSVGLGEHVVGRDVAATFPEAASLPLVTTAHDVSAEGVLSLAPTLVLADARTGPPEALQAIANAGVPIALAPEAWTLEDVWPRITAVAAALGVPAAGQALIDRTQQEVADAAVAFPVRRRSWRSSTCAARRACTCSGATARVPTR